jgi:UDP-N-acetylmuramoylalanine--D-glutamate ligase
VPALSVLPYAGSESIAVYELSSFQLASLTKSPHIAILLNIFQEHLDWHGSFGQYVQAKGNITRFQQKGDVVIYDASNRVAASLAQKSKGRKIPFTHAGGDVSSALPPFLNQKSVSAAYSVAKYFGVSKKIVEREIRSFKGLPHRLAHIGTFHSIRFFNDSLATIPEATINAIETLGKDVETLILGGFDRGVPFTKLVHAIHQSAVKTIILFPPSGERIDMALRNSKFQTPNSKFQVFKTKSMRQAVKIAYKHTAKGKICLLSPSSPSFGVFKDYAERGTLFERYVRELSRRTH